MWGGNRKLEIFYFFGESRNPVVTLMLKSLTKKHVGGILRWLGKKVPTPPLVSWVGVRTCLLGGCRNPLPSTKKRGADPMFTKMDGYVEISLEKYKKKYQVVCFTHKHIWCRLLFSGMPTPPLVGRHSTLHFADPLGGLC